MSAGQHEALGYRGANRVVLGNGFDTERFVFSNEGRQRVRDELGLQSKNFLVGTIARFHRIKDFPNLIQSAALNRDRSDDLRYLLVGPGVDWSQPSLANSIQVANLKTMIHLIGERHDIPSVLSAFDLFVLSSSGEGFPNVIGEAMACERPCVVTNVGDSAAVVGQHGIIVPPKDPKALADAILKMATMSADERKELGRKARQRVIDNYSLPKIVEQYESLYRSVIIELSAA
jgi:glycosyltransferase involved in cell wall biosynthesis